MSRAFCFGAIVAALVACAAGPAGATTLAGSVVVSPTCGGPQLDAPGCSLPLADVRLRLLDSQGAVVAETTADAQGKFVFHAASGRYRVQVMVASKLPRCPLLDVALSAATPAAPLRIDCDSGRR